MKKANLLYHTFDGGLKAVSVFPKNLKSKCSFQMELWNEAEERKDTVILNFDHVAALEFSMNFCDNGVGADLGGFYKVPGKKQKRKLLERNFKRRKKDWLMTRLSDVEAEDPDSILNYHEEIDKLEKELKKYSLYLLQSMGGAWLVLAKGYVCVEEEREALPAAPEAQAEPETLVPQEDGEQAEEQAEAPTEA